jgi:thiol-disulfide isomerase/thioredoxin
MILNYTLKELRILRVLFVLSLMALISCNQKSEGYHIQGKVTGFKDSTMLYLQNPQLQKNIDSTLIIDGKFQFNGKVDEPLRFFITTEYKENEEYKYTSFFVENKKIEIKGDYKNFLYCKVSGSESQDTENKLIDKIKSNDIKRDSLTNLFFKNKASLSENEQKDIWNEISILDSLIDIEYLAFIKENLNSYPALEKLNWRMSEMPKDTLRIYFDQLTPQFRSSNIGSFIDVYLNSRIVEIGERFIDFEAFTINGDPFKLSDVKTDYILLDFWSAGCGPCRMANKELAKHYCELKDKMEIVSFSLDVRKEWFEKASKQDSITWINVTDYKGNQSKIAIQYQISGIPCSYLINKDRIVIKKYLGFDPEFITEIKSIIF